MTIVIYNYIVLDIEHGGHQLELLRLLEIQNQELRLQQKTYLIHSTRRLPGWSLSISPYAYFKTESTYYVISSMTINIMLRIANVIL